MNRTAAIVVGFAVLCLAVVATVVLASRPESGSARPASAIVTSAATNPSVLAAQAHDVAVALGRLATDPDSLVAFSSRGQVAGRAEEGVPSGSSIHVDEASWAPDGAGGGVIAVMVRSPTLPPMTYAVVMVHEGNQWKVVATVPMTSSTPTGPT